MLGPTRPGTSGPRGQGGNPTASGVLASAAAMHKPTAKALVSAAGVKVLPHILIFEGGDIGSEARDCECR